MDLSWIDIESLLASVAVVKDKLKRDDWMFPDLNVINVNKFMEKNKKIYLQFNAKSLTQGMASNLTSCMSIAATPVLLLIQLLQKIFQMF